MKLKTYSFVFGLIGSIIGLVTAMIHYIVVIANGPNFNAFYIPESIIILICGIVGMLIALVATCFVRHMPKISGIFQIVSCGLMLGLIICNSIFDGLSNDMQAILLYMPFYVIPFVFLLFAGILILHETKETNNPK